MKYLIAILNAKTEGIKHNHNLDAFSVGVNVCAFSRFLYDFKLSKSVYTLASVRAVSQHKLSMKSPALPASLTLHI